MGFMSAIGSFATDVWQALRPHYCKECGRMLWSHQKEYCAGCLFLLSIQSAVGEFFAANPDVLEDLRKIGRLFLPVGPSPAAKVLGLQPGFTREDVNRNFKRLAMQHHPDRGGDNGRMAELNRAREEALREAKP